MKSFNRRDEETLTQSSVHLYTWAEWPYIQRLTIKESKNL